MSEIRKVPKNPRKEKIEQPKIIGAAVSREATTPKVLDHNTKQKPVEIQMREHGEVVTVQSHVRAKPRKKDEPEVRLRTMTDEQKREWEAVKSNVWEEQ
jgi:hypothetical protein